MRNRSTRLYKAGIAFGIISIVLTILVLLIDVKPIGPEGSSIGFSKLNGAVFNATGFNETWYGISDILGNIQFLVIAFFASIGAFQLFTRRSLFKVDKRIIALGVFYVIVGIIYITFLFVAVNYRPVIIEEGLEPSYPSSHSMMACSVMVSAIIMIEEMVENGVLKKVLQAICVIYLAVAVISRFLSGVHWITDIVIGIMISVSLLLLFAGVIENQKEVSRGLKFYD